MIPSFAFIFGVLPLFSQRRRRGNAQALARPSSSDARGTVSALFLTPVFYVVIMWLKERRNQTSRSLPHPIRATFRVETSRLSHNRGR